MTLHFPEMSYLFIYKVYYGTNATQDLVSIPVL